MRTLETTPVYEMVSRELAEQVCREINQNIPGGDIPGKREARIYTIRGEEAFGVEFTGSKHMTRLVEMFVAGLVRGWRTASID